MTHEISMRNDGILELAFIGDINADDIDAFQKDLRPYLEHRTKDNPLHLLLDASRDGKMSATARRTFTKLNKDPRIGKIGIINVGRVNRVTATFIMKATGRENIRFPESKAEALQWLKE